VGQLESFENGAEVTVEMLKKQGLANGSCAGIKILGVGSLTKKLTVKASAFSAEAKAKIEAVGGVCEVINKA
jgi:large subunit ribosomal protein L15